jgi:hypothetical protein
MLAISRRAIAAGMTAFMIRLTQPGMMTDRFLGQARNPSWTQRSTVIGFIGMVAGSKPNFSKTGASIDADHGANRAAATRHKHNVPRMRGETAVRVAYAVQP